MSTLTSLHLTSMDTAFRLDAVGRKDWYTYEQAAKRLSHVMGRVISPKTVRGLKNDGKIAFKKVGNSVLISEEFIVAYLGKSRPMPRGQGVAIKLYGPDKQYGAIKRTGFKSYKWYAVWHRDGKQHQRSTGIGYEPMVPRSEQVDQARQTFYATTRTVPSKKTSADAFLVTDALIAYGEGRAQHGPSVLLFADHIKFLVPFFAGKVVDDLTEDVMREYVADRMDGLINKKRPHKVSSSTARRDIDSLQAAVNWCVNNRRLDSRPFKLWKPAKAEPRTRWLSRDEAAKLIRSARTKTNARRHVPIYIAEPVYRATIFPCLAPSMEA